MKATLSQAYLNIQHIFVGSQSSINGSKNNRAAYSQWHVLASARDALATNVAQRSAHASALAQHVPAPILGVPLLASALKARRGHYGGFCPVSWVHSKRLVAIPHGSMAQRAFGVSFNGRIYTCANDKRLRQFSADPWRFVSHTAGDGGLPDDLPLSVPLGSHLRSSVDEFSFEGYCPVTFAEGRGPRDWSSIVEGDPVSAIKYRGKVYAFANASQKHKFMRNPSAYVDLELPLKLPPKMKPMSLEQLKSGGLHGVLAVMEQSLSVAAQNALLALGQSRLKFPSLSLSETASKFVALFLKAQNPNSKPELRERFAKKLDVFMSECSLAGYLKENADVLASTPRGSGVKAVRSLSDKKGGDKKAMYLQKASQFEMLCSESQESLEERFLNP